MGRIKDPELPTLSVLSADEVVISQPENCLPECKGQAKTHDETVEMCVRSPRAQFVQYITGN